MAGAQQQFLQKCTLKKIMTQDAPTKKQGV